MRDVLTETLVELEDIGRRVAHLKALLRREMEEQDHRFQQLLDAVRHASMESDEAVASFGQDCGILNPPGDGPIPPFLAGRTHAFAAIRQCGGCCSEAMDDLDDETR